MEIKIKGAYENNFKHVGLTIPKKETDSVHWFFRQRTINTRYGSPADHKPKGACPTCKSVCIVSLPNAEIFIIRNERAKTLIIQSVVSSGENIHAISPYAGGKQYDGVLCRTLTFKEKNH